MYTKKNAMVVNVIFVKVVKKKYLEVVNIVKQNIVRLVVVTLQIMIIA